MNSSQHSLLSPTTNTTSGFSIIMTCAPCTYLSMTWLKLATSFVPKSPQALQIYPFTRPTTEYTTAAVLLRGVSTIGYYLYYYSCTTPVGLAPWDTGCTIATALLSLLLCPILLDIFFPSPQDVQWVSSAGDPFVVLVVRLYFVYYSFVL